MLSFESSLSNTVNDGDDDDALSGFLLGLATSRAALGCSWSFTTDGMTLACDPQLASICRLLRHARELIDSILLTAGGAITFERLEISTLNLIYFDDEFDFICWG